MLSRFRSKKEQTETLEKLKKGQVDILIGTHRVLSKDVEFADLGLIIIDEEQRFGVKHKETLKELKKQVDVLTLTPNRCSSSNNNQSQISKLNILDKTRCVPIKIST